MIPVGLHVTDKYFKGPAEPIADFHSKKDPEMYRDGIDKHTGKAMIKRIVLNRTANVELLRAESPSSIWVRLPNHTANDFTFAEPFKIRPILGAVAIGDYAIAPIAERLFGRCRILETENTNGLIKIFFIDDATVAWVEPECLGELPEHYMFFPWQAIQISIMGICPAVRDDEPELKWTESTCNKLNEILLAFPFLRIEICMSRVVFNDYARPLVCKLYGTEVDVDQKDHLNRSVEIRNILVKQAESEVVVMDFHDAACHEFFEVSEEEKIPEEALEHHRRIPEDWKHEGEEEIAEKERLEKELFQKDSLVPEIREEDGEDWNPRDNLIEMVTIQDLEREFKFPDDDDSDPSIMLAVEGKCTKSPFEWYARPIKKIGKNSDEENVPWTSESELKEVDMVDWLIYGNDQLTSFAEQLDTYYSNAKNRKPLKAEDIKQLQEEKRKVFAVCAVNEEKANYTGEWQRVLIVKCDVFAEVQFLDSGGRDMVLTTSLYRIHRQHCRFPPMCLRFSMHGVTTVKNRMKPDKSWALTETSRFKMCLRPDVPIFIKIKDLAPMIPPPNDFRPWFDKHVLMVKDVEYQDESRSLMTRYLDPEIDGHPDIDPNEPTPWTP